MIRWVAANIAVAVVAFLITFFGLNYTSWSRSMKRESITENTAICAVVNFPWKNKPNDSVQIVMSEKMDDQTATKYYMDTSIDRGQRNEAANFLRANYPTKFLALSERILESNHETDLFKSWVFQHIGLMAPSMDETQSRHWIALTKTCISSSQIGCPKWRESVYAFSFFKNDGVKAWIYSHLKGLTAEQRSNNRFIIDEIYNGGGINRNHDDDQLQDEAL